MELIPPIIYKVMEIENAEAHTTNLKVGGNPIDFI